MRCCYNRAETNVRCQVGNHILNFWLIFAIIPPLISRKLKILHATLLSAWFFILGDYPQTLLTYYAKDLIPILAYNGQMWQVTTSAAALNAVAAFEVWCWYCVGEIIGKGSIIGYDVWVVSLKWVINMTNHMSTEENETHNLFILSSESPFI